MNLGGMALTSVTLRRAGTGGLNDAMLDASCLSMTTEEAAAANIGLHQQLAEN
jgi:hypothetical protein